METTLSRRSFAQKTGFGIAGLLMSTMLTVGCTFGGVTNAIKEYVGVGLQAFQAVVDLLTGSGVIPAGAGAAIEAVIALVKAGFADILKAVADYQNAPADQKQSLLGKISTVLSIVVANIQQFWNDLSIPDAKLSALIQGLLGIIISTLQGFLTQLPAPVSAEPTIRAAGLPRKITVSPVKRKMGEFKKEFNGMLAAAGQSQYAIK